MRETISPEIIAFLEKNEFMVSLSPEKLIFKKGKVITFDLSIKELSITKSFPWKVNNSYPFEQLNNFEVMTTEQYADATPFHDGYKEYIHSVRLNLSTGKVIKLFNFTDRDPKGEKKLGVLVDTLRQLIR